MEMKVIDFQKKNIFSMKMKVIDFQKKKYFSMKNESYFLILGIVIDKGITRIL